MDGTLDLPQEQGAWFYIVNLAGDIGAGGLLILVVILILRGALVPGKEMRYWRQAFFEEQRQKHDLLEAGQVTREVLKAIPTIVESVKTDEEDRDR